MSEKVDLICGQCGKPYVLDKAFYDKFQCETVAKVCADCEKHRPYSVEDYNQAKRQGFDLDNWNDYVRYFELGEGPEHD